jgi:hypothetical protein
MTNVAVKWYIFHVYTLHIRLYYINSNMRMDLSECMDFKEFLELLIIKWRLTFDYCNVSTPLIIYPTVSISVVSNKRSFSKMKQIKKLHTKLYDDK